MKAVRAKLQYHILTEKATYNQAAGPEMVF
jgi:hypothetical protein